MAEMIDSTIPNQLASTLHRETIEGLRLVMDAGNEIPKFLTNLQAVQRVLDDAEYRQVNDEDVRFWLTELKSTLYDIDDALDEWNTAVRKLEFKEAENAVKPIVRKVCSFSPSFLYERLVLRRDIAFRIKKLNKSLDVINMEKDKFNFKLIEGTTEVLKGQETASFFEMLSSVHGRDEDREKVLDYLLSESSRAPTLPIISIVGRGGIGKTTLARLVFNEVNNHFDERIWVSVSYPLDDIRIAKAILKSLKVDASNLAELEIVLQRIRQYIKGKKFLLVLDDLETTNLTYWTQLYYYLKSGAQGSRILVTKSEEDAVKEIETSFTIRLRPLSEEDSWSLFSQVAFSGTERKADECVKLEEISRNILPKCKGLPLAIKVLGCILRSKRHIGEWQNILHSEIWELNEAEKGLLPPLILSYLDLPSILRKCFSYCAVFPKNYEIEKNRLIKLWMSQSYLKVEGREDMEVIGEEYFENLVMHSFFQDFQRNEYNGSIISCKMHDIVHNFAHFLTKNECSIVEVNGSENFNSKSSYEGVKHLMVMYESEGSFSNCVYNERKLRSLVVEPRGGFVNDIDLRKLFDQLRCLRALDLSNHDNFWFKVIKEVPKGIKNLIHLRYLNFSRNKKIRELPETLCELYNLQTLEVNWCTNLKNLPHGIGNLINLRHIVNDGTSLSYMPKGIERLTHLRTLSEFVMSCGNGSKVGTIECLNNLNHLQTLRIKKLGNVTDVNEVEKAKLRNKENLRDLYISFENDEKKGRKNGDDEEALEKFHEKALENLQSPPNLERLEIFYYGGTIMLSSWLLSLTKLKLMSLDRCMNLKILPPLGKLPSLESLIIRSMRNVERVGNEFLGVESDNILLSSSVHAFPKLKYLEFQKMKEWRKWDYDISSLKGKDITIMPCLGSLTIGFCPKLEKLPDYIPQGTTQKIISCLILEGGHKNETGDNWQKILL